MSLLVWLPLNGNLLQQGLSSVNATMMGTGITYSAGKIGLAATFPNNCNSCIYLPRMRLLTGTYAAWIKVIGAGATSRQCIISEGRDSYNDGVEFYTSQAGTSLSFKAHEKVITTTIVLNQWYHIAGTFGNGEVKLYVNGELKGTLTYIADMTYQYALDLVLGKMSYSYTNTSNYFSFNGLLNDVRIYDHALSVKEVEEISKGLILHYKLDDSYMLSAENIMPNYLEMALGSTNASTGTWRLAGSSNMTRERVLITDSPEGECYGFLNSGILTANDGSCYGIDSFPLDGNSVYTISMWARCTSGSNGFAGYNIYNATDKGGSYTTIDKNYRVTPLPASGEWVKCWYTFTTNASNTRNIYIGITTGSTSVTTLMCCIHIEKVDNTVDTVIYDSSGYLNNGDITNGIVTSNSARYSNALVLNGTTVDNSSNTKVGAAYLRGFLSLTLPTALTVAWWGKNDTYGRGGIFLTTVLADPSECTDYNTTTIANWDSTLRVYNGSNSFNFFSYFIKDGTWHHHTIVFDGSYVYYCCDGIEKTKAALTGPLVSFTGFCMGLGKAGGVYRLIKLSISDVRIYATALTETQVKELYNTSMTIDKNGNMYTRELVE